MGSDNSAWWKNICQLDIGGMESSNSYSVKGVYRVLRLEIPNFSSPLWPKALDKSIPLKVSCLVWRLFQNIIATKDNLFKKSAIGQGSLQCVGLKNRYVIYFSSIQFLHVYGTVYDGGLGSLRLFKMKEGCI